MEREEKTTKNVFTHPFVVCAVALLCCLLWGSAFPCIKIGYTLFSIASTDTASVILFAGVRFTLAGVLVILIGSALRKKILRPQRASWGKIFLLALAQTSVQYTFFYIGLAHTTGVKSSVVGATSAFFCILVAAFLFRQEKFTVGKAVGCLLGFSGVVLVNINGFSFDFTFLGEGFILFANLSYAFSAAMIKEFSKKEDTFALSGYQFFFGGIMLVAIGLCLGGRLTAASPFALPMLFYLAVVSAVSYTLWGMLLKYNKPSHVAAYGFMNPVFGVILSALLLKEEVNWLFCCIALLLITAGILYINLLEPYIRRRKGLD
jgi:drug/metabolite transporter (DMT)-like permease